MAPPPAAQGGVFAQIPDLVDRVEPSVVAVLTDGGQGSGVVWDADGAVVTNDHVADALPRVALNGAGDPFCLEPAEFGPAGASLSHALSHSERTIASQGASS